MTANPRCQAADSKQKLLRNQIKFNKKKSQIKEAVVCVMEWSFELILFFSLFNVCCY